MSRWTLALTALLLLAAAHPSPTAAQAAPCAAGEPAARRNVLLVSARLQDDGSIRLLLADPAADSSAPTMSAELDQTGCDGGDTADTSQAARGAYDAFVAAFGLPPADAELPLWRYAALGGPVRAGAAGEVGVAPVLSFNLVTLATPVTAAALDSAADAYRAQAAAGLQELAAGADRLQGAVDDGRLDDARALWLAAHECYARLGAAYGTFGAFDEKIDGRADGLPGGVNDPDFTGFLRLEDGLWGGQSAADLQPVADQLDRDVHDLLAAFPTLQTDPADLPLRAHEILENTLQFELTGQTDEGSHTNLATARADVDGTRLVLAALQPLLEPRTPRLWRSVTGELDALAVQLDGYQQTDGSWLPLDDLTRDKREHLDGALGQALEDLAAVPDVLELPPPLP